MRWRTVRKWWAILGSSAFLIFSLWSLIAFQAWSVPNETLKSNELVQVSESSEAFYFRPTRSQSSSALAFFPGGLVNPQAYAPVARRIAEAGYPAVIVKIPFRGAFRLTSSGEVNGRTLRVMSEISSTRWVVSGHSKGAFYAAEFAHAHPERTGALALIGSAHPRHRDLSGMALPVTKIYATRDGLATLNRVKASAGNLPAATRWVRINGGNHSQFGYYGFQPGDKLATISRDDQQTIVRRELLRLLAER